MLNDPEFKCLFKLRKVHVNFVNICLEKYPIPLKVDDIKFCSETTALPSGKQFFADCCFESNKVKCWVEYDKFVKSSSEKRISVLTASQITEQLSKGDSFSAIEITGSIFITNYHCYKKETYKVLSFSQNKDEDNSVVTPSFIIFVDLYEHNLKYKNLVKQYAGDLNLIIAKLEPIDIFCQLVINPTNLQNLKVHPKHLELATDLDLAYSRLQTYLNMKRKHISSDNNEDSVEYSNQLRDEAILKIFQSKPDTQLADLLGSIKSIYSEVSEEHIEMLYDRSLEVPKKKSRVTTEEELIHNVMVEIDSPLSYTETIVKYLKDGKPIREISAFMQLKFDCDSAGVLRDIERALSDNQAGKSINQISEAQSHPPINNRVLRIRTKSNCLDIREEKPKRRKSKKDKENSILKKKKIKRFVFLLFIK
ncbi:uncharacterized protein LOC116418039 [Nasonia vitripennis]|uniref:Uncharacterized protein n=1 Tax=Nasonia vitripennis TaxID=7425 RepID=A0A7M7R3U3_NASVI|nr:uncharacterized protein LOC116418039 [Nasonia vitripennis]